METRQQHRLSHRPCTVPKVQLNWPVFPVVPNWTSCHQIRMALHCIEATVNWPSSRVFTHKLSKVRSLWIGILPIKYGATLDEKVPKSNVYFFFLVSLIQIGTELESSIYRLTPPCRMNINGNPSNNLCPILLLSQFFSSPESNKQSNRQWDK